MANKRYSELAENLGFPKTSKDRQGNDGTPSKMQGAVYGMRGKKDPGGDMPMRDGTADWKMPAGFTAQPRDRSWGMRRADGLATDIGLCGPGYDDEEGETYIKR